MIGGRLLALCIACSTIAACASNDLPSDSDVVVRVIPLPNEVTTSSGAFLLRPSTRIVVSGGEDALWLGNWLADLLRNTAQIDLQVSDAIAGPGASNAIVFETGTLPEDSDDEAYRLSVSPDRIVVAANDSAGLFYAAVTLWQLATAIAGEDTAIRIPAMRIDDAPRFAWRGLMLDSARHYQSPEFIKQLIDVMALHKLNVLHWHLTDDQGWRLEIKKYPKLTSVGAWRVPAGPAAAADIDPATGKPRLHGGFYSQDQVRDIVAFAAARHVTIVPEIEMPGHAQAAIAAYPEWGVGEVTPDVSADWGIHNYLFNVEESTFAALENILSEVMDLFPSRYIHVGGDEAVKTQWAASERVQQRMQELGVESETQLQSYFIQRIERFLNAHGRRLIGWDEILEGGIAPQATVMSWQGIDGALAAASLGHDTVLSPSPTLYFDHLQSRQASEPPGRGLVISLEDVYRFEPIPAGLNASEQRHVLGLQGNVWSEHIRTEERLAYMTLPRAAALAEVAWTQPGRMDWTGFLDRLATQFDRYRALNIPFATSAFDVRVTATVQKPHDAIAVELSNQSGFGAIRYTVDGSQVTAESPRYTDALELPADTELAAVTFADGRRMSRETRGKVGHMARRRFSQELTLCSDRIVLSLEDDAPLEGNRSVFLADILNPCWIWPQADLSAVTGVEVAVGQVPFNFQPGTLREQVELAPPETAAGELEVRADGCDGNLIAVLPLQKAAQNNDVTVLSAELPGDGPTDLCFRFTAEEPDPMWAIDWVELSRAAEPSDMQEH